VKAGAPARRFVCGLCGEDSEASQSDMEAFAEFRRIAIQEGLDGKVVDWMEKVTNEQYQAGSITS
jgi:hypothetical protein